MDAAKETQNKPSFKTIQLREIEGFVKISNKARDKLEKLIKNYGVRRLARNLKFDRGTIDSIYRGKKFVHSVTHLIKIARALNYDLRELEKEVRAYGNKQANIYNFNFPFVLSPICLRAVTIHGDGSYDKINGQTEYYQEYKHIHYFESLLRTIFEEAKSRKKSDSISSITVPSILVKLVCKTLKLKLKDFQTEKFFYRVTKLPLEYKFQVFLQFIVDEGHFKGTTLTVAQHKKETRNGFILLLDSLGFKHSSPKNNRDDITIYGFNFPKILNYLDWATNKYGNIAGLWFKENQFREICKRAKPYNSFKLVRNRI